MVNSTTFWVLSMNAVLCASGMLFGCLTMLRARRLLLLPMALCFFWVTNGVTQGVPLWFNLGIDFPTQTIIYERALGVDAIIWLVALPGLIALCVVRTAPEGTRRPIPVSLLLMVTAIAVCSSGYFALRNREALPLVWRLYTSGGYHQYVDLRNRIGAIINAHFLSGNAPATWAFAVWCPFLFYVLPGHKRISRGLRWLWLGLVATATMIPALIIGSRFMLVFAVVIPLLAWVIRRVDLGLLVRRIAGARRLVLGAVAAVAIATFVFQYFFNLPFFQSMAQLAGRSFAVPAAVSGCYYYAFPKFFAFRGWAGILKFPIATDTVNFHLVSLRTTGLDTNANGSFAATAYSAAGLAGVAVASVLIIGAAVVVDLGLRRVPRREANAVTFANLIGASVLSFVPAMVAITTYGFLLGPVIFWVLYRVFGCSSAGGKTARELRPC